MTDEGIQPDRPDEAAAAAPIEPAARDDAPVAEPDTVDGTPPHTEEALDAAARAAETIVDETMALSELEADLPPAGIDLLGDVDLNVTIELGRTRMLVEDVLRLNADSVIELDKAAGDPVDIFVNDRHVARGEVLVVDESFCIRVSQIIRPPG